MNTKTPTPPVQPIIENVAIMVNNNNHTQALHFIALVFGLRKYAAIFSYLMSIQNLEGHIPSELVKYRQNVTTEMFRMIETIYGKSTAEAIQAAL